MKRVHRLRAKMKARKKELDAIKRRRLKGKLTGYDIQREVYLKTGGVTPELRDAWDSYMSRISEEDGQFTLRLKIA